MSAKEEEIPEQMKLAFSRCRHVELGAGRLKVTLNPVVTVVSFLLIWIFVIVCMATPDYMLRAMSVLSFGWVPEVWTWFYIVSQDIWIAVLLFVMCVSKYGNLKLGKDDDQPEYTFATWFSMLFSAGVAIGLFYYSVAEPVWHYTSTSARYSKEGKGYGNDNEDATHALMISFYHWGLHGWIPYVTMGAVIAMMTYRRGFPMTIRYCFWPLIGERCYGWIGDAIDILSIVTTIFGVCTSLGLGAMQVNAGLQRLNYGFYRGVNYAVPDEPKYADPGCGGTGRTCGDGLEAYGVQKNVGTQILIIIVITICATASVASGMNRGIVNLSRVNFALGMFLMLTVLFLGETYFCMDAMIQAFGYYVWYLWKVSFQTDAFERLGGKDLGLGGAPDGEGGSDAWLKGWTLFYWGWWISWGPFVGTFLAKISKGRTLRQFILGTLIIPSLYSFVWFGIFGSEGIRMQRMAEASGVCTTTAASACQSVEGSQNAGNCLNYAGAYSDEAKRLGGLGWNPSCVLDPNYHGGFGKCKEFAWTRYVQVGSECVESTSWVKVPCGGGADPTLPAAALATGACAGKIKPEHLDASSGSKMFNHFPASTQPSCFVPVQDGVVCLSKQSTEDIFFDQISSYGPRGFSDLLSALSMIALVMYFVTSSDSGSYVVDMISANGHPDPPLLQRICWSFTEGATACALLAAGRNLPNSDGSLKALQSASLFTGLPYTFVLFWCAQSLVLLCREESGVVSKDRKAFRVFIFDVSRPKSLAMNTVAPGISMGKVVQAVGGWPLSKSSPDLAWKIWTGVFQCMYTVPIILVLCAAALYQWCVIGLVLYTGFATFLGFLRASVRNAYKIEHGDLITDLICAFFAPMFTLAQIEQEIEAGLPKLENKEGSNEPKLEGEVGSNEVSM